jgi:hypothetical protein
VYQVQVALGHEIVEVALQPIPTRAVDAAQPDDGAVHPHLGSPLQCHGFGVRQDGGPFGRAIDRRRLVDPLAVVVAVDARTRRVDEPVRAIGTVRELLDGGRHPLDVYVPGVPDPATPRTRREHDRVGVRHCRQRVGVGHVRLHGLESGRPNLLDAGRRPANADDLVARIGELAAEFETDVATAENRHAHGRPSGVRT